MKNLKRFLPYLAAVAVLAAFALAYSFLPFDFTGKFASPDEASNAHFSQLWAQDGKLWYFDTLTIPSLGTGHPRSMNVSADGFVVPGGFIGLPVLYGGVANLLGTNALPFITPFLAVLAALAWFGLVAKYAGRRAGLIAALLLLANPAYWYVASRTLQPNAPFVAFMIFAAYFFFAQPFGSMLDRAGAAGHRLLRCADPVIAGIFLAVALAFRMSEAYWIALGGLVLVVRHRKALPWARLALLVFGAVAGLVPFFGINVSVFGSPFATGYGSVTAVSALESMQGFGNRLLGPLRPYLFPLGFAPRTALANLWTFGLAFFWWWTAAVAAAVAYFWRKRASVAPELRRGAADFLWLALAVSGWLALFYGSWTFRDAPDPNAVSIGSSFFRYWLPAFVMSTVPVAWALDALATMLGERRGRAALAGALVGMVAVSGVTVFHAKGEGLFSVRHDVRAGIADARRVIALTPDDAVIVTDYDDKFLFPHRKVMVPLRSDATYEALPRVVAMAPLYYYGITFPATDLAFLRDVKLSPAGLTIEPVEAIGQKTLYRFERK